MPSSSFNWFQDFSEKLGTEVHDLSSDTIKVALSNTAPSATNTQLSDITQIASGGGYTNGAGGGYSLSSVTWTESGGTGTFDAGDLTITATGAAIATHRYYVLYNDTATNDELIGWLDYGSAVDLADTESVDITFNASGIFTLAQS